MSTPSSIGKINTNKQANGSSMNDVTALAEGAQGFCDDSNEALLLKSVTMRKEGLQNVQYCVTSNMDNP